MTTVRTIQHRTACAVVALLLATARIAVPADALGFEHLTAHDGLAQNTATSILQDSRGFLWIGSEGGLNRFDGYEFKVFKPDPEDSKSLPSTQVWTLFEDSTGVLWVGTYAGLARFDRVTETFDCFRHDPMQPDSLSDDSVRSILKDSRGDLWVGTKGGLNRMITDPGETTQPTSVRFEHFVNDPDDPASLSANFVRSLHEDEKGRLWVGTNGGLNLFDPETGSFWHFGSSEGAASGVAVQAIESALADDLWVGTLNRGLNRFDPNTGEFTHVRLSGDQTEGSESILALTHDRSGTLWVGTYGGGLVLLDPTSLASLRVEDNPPSSESLGDDIVWSIFEDSSGIVWVGTSKGLAKYNPGRRKFALHQASDETPESVNFNYVRSVVEDRSGAVWVGSRGGLLILDSKTGLLRPFEIKGGQAVRAQVRALMEDSHGVLWVGTDSGLWTVGSERSTLVDLSEGGNVRGSPAASFITSIIEDQDRNVWVGTRGEGLSRIVLGQPDASGRRSVEAYQTWRADPGDPGALSDDHVRTLLEDNQGRLWVGTHSAGLELFDRQLGRFLHFPPKPDDPQRLSWPSITVVHENRAGDLWIGTYGGGLNRFDPETGVFSRITERDGLADNVIYGILEDQQGRLWLSSNRGVSRFEPDAQEPVFRNFGLRDGLQGPEFNSGAYHRSDDGAMFFGGVNGLNGFRPADVHEDPQPPQVVLTELQILDRTITPGLEIDGRTILDCSIVECRAVSLTYDENVFSLGFSGLHFAEPAANTYTYILEGFDRRWHNVGTGRLATYTRVPPGRYLFRVRAANADGLWSEQEAVLPIVIRPPFWMTWWFRAGTITGALFLVAAAYRLRTRRIRSRARELETAYNATIEGWARVLELRDEDTVGHTRRVTDMTVALASRMGFSTEEQQNFRRGAILHDIGKMAVPDVLLRKKGKLSDADWAEIRQHPEYSMRMLKGITFLDSALEIPYAHHERWDGSGYPRGLVGEEIPLEARIFAVVDVWDALRSDRPYREGWDAGRVRQHIIEGSGTMFDPTVVKEFLALVDSEAGDIGLASTSD